MKTIVRRKSLFLFDISAPKAVRVVGVDQKDYCYNRTEYRPRGFPIPMEKIDDLYEERICANDDLILSNLSDTPHPRASHTITGGKT